MVGAYVAGTAMTTAWWTAVAAKAAFSAAVSLVSESLMHADAPQQSPVSSDVSSRKQLIRSSIEPRRAIYGATQTSGALMYGSNGSDANYVHLVIAIAGHACQAINNTYFGTEVVGDLDANGNVITGRFAGYVRIRKYLGSETQEPDPDLGIECPEWGAKYRPGKGITYVYLRIKRSRDVWPTGLPTPKFDVLGKNDILDVRTGLTGYTTNAALISLDYILWKRGFNSTLDEVNQTTWITAANICDEVVAVPGGGTQPRYTINGSFTLDAQRAEILDEMRGAMAGAALYSMGVWEGYAGAASSPVIDLSEKHLRGPYKVHPRAGDDQVYNAVKGTYIETTQWTETDFPSITNPLYEAQDGGERIYKDVKLPFTTDPYMAQRIVKIDLERHRQPVVVEYPARLIGLKVKVWEVVRLSIAKQGWSNKQFRVVDKKISLFGGADLVLEEYTPAIYTMLVSEMVTVDPAPDTTLENPFIVEVPAGLQLFSGTAELLKMGDGSIVSRIKATWTPPTSGSIRETQIQYKKTTDPETDWVDAAPVKNGVGPAWISPVQDGIEYQVRQRFVNGFDQQSGWSEIVAHVVVGKDEKPADVDGFSVAQNGSLVLFRCNARPASEEDFAAVDVYCNPVGVLTLLGDPAATMPGTSFTSADVQPGAWSFIAVARDTSGNLSVNPARCDLTIESNHDIIQQTEHGLQWSGCTLTYFVRHWTGVLIPQGQSAVSTQGWETFNPGVPDPHPDCYVEAPEVDLLFDCAVRLWGNSAPGSAGLSLEVDWKLAAGVYGGWRPWTVGDVNARYAKFRLHLNTLLGQSSISAFQTTADALEFAQSGALAIAAGGTAITFPTQYHFSPGLTVKNTGGTALIPGYTGLTPTGATLHLYDLTGASAGGSGGWDSSGV